MAYGNIIITCIAIPEVIYDFKKKLSTKCKLNYQLTTSRFVPDLKIINTNQDRREKSNSHPHIKAR